MPTDALLTFGMLKLTSLILTAYRGGSRGLQSSLDWYVVWDKGEWMDMEMRGSGAMRVEKGHELATCCRSSIL